MVVKNLLLTMMSNDMHNIMAGLKSLRIHRFGFNFENLHVVAAPTPKSHTFGGPINDQQLIHLGLVSVLY